MKMIDYREALGLDFNDIQKVEALRNRICTTFSKLNSYISLAKAQAFYENPTMNFTKYYREVCEVPLRTDYKDLGGVLHSILAGQDISTIVLNYVAFMNSLDNCFTDFPNFKDVKRFIFQELPNHLDAIGVSYSKIKDNDGIFIIPTGAKELDDALVSAPLEWLSKYPEARKAWVKALKDYSDQTDDNASDIADKFRKALEAFFQEFFGGSRSVEKYIEDHTYEKYLDAHGVAADLRDELKNTINAYTKYINNNAKHHDKTNRNILEYLMYQTGNIIRLLITLKEGENT